MEKFSYQYSAKQNREVENIRRKYMPKEVSKIDMLKDPDFRVQTAGRLQGLIIGVIGCLIFGIGICFFLHVFEVGTWLTILCCVAGIVVMLPAYPVFRHIAKKTKAELAPEILRLSDEIMKS